MTKSCSIQHLASILGRKWVIQIVYHLHQHHRFGALEKAIEGINPATLSKRLKFLEQERIIERAQFDEMPPRVEYHLTEKGLALGKVLDAMQEWTDRWGDPSTR